MADHSVPNDPKKFTITAFITFVVVFVFAMLMMLWHGSGKPVAEGKMQYETKVAEPTDGNHH